MKYPNKLSQLRKNAKDKITQGDLADFVQTTVQNISKYEKGERKIPPNVALKISKFLAVSPNEIYGWEGATSRREDDVAAKRLASIFKDLKLSAEDVAKLTPYSTEDIQKRLSGEKAVDDSFLKAFAPVIKVDEEKLIAHVLHYQDFYTKLNELNWQQITVLESMIDQMLGKR